jgi:hypothetical protein
MNKFSQKAGATTMSKFCRSIEWAIRDYVAIHKDIVVFTATFFGAQFGFIAFIFITN